MSNSKKDERLRALPTRRERAWQWFVEATERGDSMDADDMASMLGAFADFEMEEAEAKLADRDTELASIRRHLGGHRDSQLDGSNGLAQATFSALRRAEARVSELEGEVERLTCSRCGGTSYDPEDSAADRPQPCRECHSDLLARWKAEEEIERLRGGIEATVSAFETDYPFDSNVRLVVDEVRRLLSPTKEESDAD